MKKTPYTQKSLNVLARIFILSVSGVGFSSYAQVGPAGVNIGIVTWLDASDIDGDGILNDQPVDGDTVATWNGGIGTHDQILTATNGTVSKDQVFTITVTNANDAPVISSVPVTSVDEDNIYTYTFASTDVDVNDELTYSAPELPLWLRFNNSTGILSGTPTREFIGNHEVTLRVNDGTVDIDQIFIITVVPNIAPVVVAGQTFSVDEKSPEGTEIGLARAVDDNGNTLKNWTIVDGNQGSAFLINPSTGMITVNSAVELDFDIHSSFTLLIAVGDGFSVSLPVSVTITVNDVMEGL